MLINEIVRFENINFSLVLLNTEETVLSSRHDLLKGKFETYIKHSSSHYSQIFSEVFCDKKKL